MPDQGHDEDFQRVLREIEEIVGDTAKLQEAIDQARDAELRPRQLTQRRQVDRRQGGDRRRADRRQQS